MTDPAQPVDRPASPATGTEQVRARHQSNRRAWNEGAAYYTGRVDETIDFIRAGQSSLHDLERAVLGDLHQWCETAIHLQCASGRDTLSLWVEGAQQVIGVDISEVMIANARRTSESLGAPARWFCADVLDTPGELDGTADLVYTGRGAINWIHDINAWAEVVARLLKPGGVLSILDEHPSSWFFDMTADELRLERGINYFGTAWESQGWPAEYIGELDLPPAAQAVKYDRLWNFADIFGSLAHAGLSIEHLGEHPVSYWSSFPNLRAADRERIPQTFTLVARKPSEARAR